MQDKINKVAAKFQAEYDGQIPNLTVRGWPNGKRGEVTFEAAWYGLRDGKAVLECERAFGATGLRQLLDKAAA